MTAVAHPVVLYVPGLLPKPESIVHGDALLRCLRAGLGRIAPDIGQAIASTRGAFDVVSWTYDFYGEYRDFAIDAAAVDELIAQDAPSERDIEEAVSWKRRFARFVYLLGDRLPFLIPHLANERTELHLRDLRRYVRDDNGIAAHTRRMVKVPLQAACKAGHPVMLIGHSMGSVIAFEALWELTRDRSDAEVDLFVTMGSPLGQRYMQQRLIGNRARGAEKYPRNIRRWKNLAAIGDLTSIDRRLANDYSPMLRLGLIESLDDEDLFTWYRLNGALNPHAEYGYLASDATARVVADWWRRHDPAVAGA